MRSITAATIDVVLAEAADRPVLIDFSAAWCPPCRMIKPVVEKLARELGDAAVVAVVDTDAEPDLAARFAVRSLPTLIVVRRGREVARAVGFQPEPALRALVARDAA